MQSSVKARAGGIVRRCRRAIATVLMSSAMLLTTATAHAAAFTEDFSAEFSDGTSVQRTLGGQSFVFSIANLLLLRARIRLEEQALGQDNDYLRFLGDRPRFVPGPRPRLTLQGTQETR